MDALTNGGRVGSASLELLVGKDAASRIATRSDVFLITKEGLFDLIDESSRTHRLLNDTKGSELLRRLTRRFADRLYDGLAPPRSDRLVFRECLAFLLETEIFWHLPIRHLARYLARSTSPETTFAIELRDTVLKYGLLWDDNEIWPLTLAWEFARLDRRAKLYLERSSEHPVDSIEILPDSNLVRRRRTAFDAMADTITSLVPGSRLFCPKTVRNHKSIAKTLAPHLRLMTALDGRRPILRIDVTPLFSDIGRLSIPLEKETASAADGSTYCVSRWPRGGLVKELVERFDEAADSTYRAAVSIVERRRIDRIDTADHLNFEASAFSIAVARRGGEIHLWSHASNPIAVHYRAPIFKSVCVPTEVSAYAWRDRFPDVDITVAPWTVLPQFTCDAPRDESGRLALVVFGIRGFLGATPRFRFAEHEASLRHLVGLVTELDGVRFHYKSKDVANALWFESRVDPERRAERTDTKFDSLNWPNMIFASATIPSTALLEGICRGIPAVMLRDTPAFDHVPIDADAIPILGAEGCSELLASLRDHQRYSELADRQAEWLRSIL